MKKWKKYIIIYSTIFFIALFSFLYFRYHKDTEASLLSDTIDQQVIKILEVSSIKYSYSNIVTYEDNKKISGFNIPFTSKSFIIKYKGYIKSGIDLNDIMIDMVNPRTIKITLAKPSVLDNVIEEEGVYTYNEKDSVFNKLSFNDLYGVLTEEKKAIENEAIENGLLNEAEENIKDVLMTFLKGMGFEDIQIIFK
ncbi:MAG TPA: DUF4230 domain-containing protein [Tepidimicrobium sp.]|nr:DUF4230 domain-containing protein [Tepidimicrobium sp.]